MKKNYHGSSSAAIDSIHSGKIDWSLGGGELGKGFYTTPDIWVASKASWNCDDKEEVSVVELVVKNLDYLKLHQEAFDLHYAQLEREKIKRMQGNGPRDYVYDFFDIIQSPIVGKGKYNRNLQHKWQSDAAEDLLNSDKVQRIVK
ncbi:hypothetical protein K8B33_08525 [Alcanivorax sp. JB21]|uniref:hypothetical protein n=1 Tax=Alcanivorax limicola TaxID=2874102 RepID=UPI001CBDB2B1|nr:hypothetical protein [Alcanivorax limicola]MBZ2189140.1 hypothetical protein [Alcanivorax limicola]